MEMEKQVKLQPVAGSIGDIKAERSMTLLRDVIHITKPRIILSNLFAAFAGFWLASQGNVDWLLMLEMLAGSMLVMASACVFNNILDREMDQRMVRTSNRPLAKGRLQPAVMVWYAGILGGTGLVILFNINLLSGIFGLIGITVYVVIYTAWLKRTSTLSTVVGSISGSMPPIIGYCAVSSTMDAGAWILFFILFLWQPPHFWALGIRRREEYRIAGFQILPVVKGVMRTKIQMIPYVVLLILTTILLFAYHFVGKVYLISALILGLVWLAYCIAGFYTKTEEAWAKKTFMASIYYLMITFLIMIIDTVKV
jgi:protoheme IX farnesyltransferase